MPRGEALPAGTESVLIQHQVINSGAGFFHILDVGSVIVPGDVGNTFFADVTDPAFLGTAAAITNGNDDGIGDQRRFLDATGGTVQFTSIALFESKWFPAAVAGPDLTGNDLIALGLRIDNFQTGPGGRLDFTWVYEVEPLVNNGVVPEPGTLAVWSGLGLISIIGASRRRRWVRFFKN